MTKLADSVDNEVGYGAGIAIGVAIGEGQVAFEGLVLDVFVVSLEDVGEFPGLGVEDELVGV